jgi:biopolymer transport protein ExbB/TolQ
MESAHGGIVGDIAQVLHALGVGWVMWLLIGLSVLSVAVVIERLIFYLHNSFGEIDELLALLKDGQIERAAELVGDRRGLEAEVVRQGLQAAPRGAEAVEEILAATVGREKLRYERYLAFLATLGSNAPFVGLFGTVLGIVEAFAQLAVTAKTGGFTSHSADVMGGISEALVATAIGLFVALPAVAVYNAFGRWLQTIIGRSQALSHALAGYLKSTEGTWQQ